MKTEERAYYGKNGQTYQVTVQPRSVRLKCRHEWRRRIFAQVESKWGYVCTKCGGCRRG